MPSYDLPGVYVQEVTPSGAFQAAKAGVAGLVGKFPAGTVNVAVRCGSFDDFYQTFGGLCIASAAYDAYAFFKQGGKTLVVVRVTGTASTVTIKDRTSPTPLDKMKVTLLVDGTHGDYAAGPPKAGCQCVIADGTITDTFKATFNYYYGEKGSYGTYAETYDNLSPDPAATRYFETVINAASSAVVIVDLAPTNIAPANRPAVGTYATAGGVEPDYSNTDEGLEVLKAETDVRVVFADDAASGTRQALIDHCTDMGDRVCVLSPGQYMTPAEVKVVGDALDEDRAILPYPWVMMYDPLLTNAARSFKPAGFYAGVLARIDPYRSPSNQLVEAAVGLERTLSRADLVNVQNSKVSPIYLWGTRGIRVRNGINCSSDANLSQIYRRRMTDYEMETADINLQFAVSQPITPTLYAAVRSTMHNALENQKRDGWIEGYRVVCDDTNNTAETKAARKLMVRIVVKLWNVADYVVVDCEVSENAVIMKEAA